MARAQDEMTAHIRNLEVNYQNVLNEMVCFQRNMAQQDGLMQNLISYFLQLENGGLSSHPSHPSNTSSSNPNSNSRSSNLSSGQATGLNLAGAGVGQDGQVPMVLDDGLGGVVSSRTMNALLSLSTPPLTGSNPLVVV